MLDLTKPVQTRDGCKVRILCTDFKNNFCIVAIRTNPDGSESLTTSKLSGAFASDSLPDRKDLVNVPQRHKHADAIIAWANGAEIECKYPGKGDNWIFTIKPEWNEFLEYRVRK